MKCSAHIRDDGKEQPLKEHLENTALMAEKFADSFHAGEWGYCCGMLHDIGKYSVKFQKRLRGEAVRTDHSTAGAQLCWQKKAPYAMLSYCIAGHHAGLPDTGTCMDESGTGTLMGRMKKKTDDCSEWENEIAVPTVTGAPFETVKGENITFFRSVFIRLLYSCLVDADFLDTESFMSGGSLRRDSGEPTDRLCERLERHIEKWLSSTQRESVNGRRSEILRNCLAQAEEKPGLFRLTVPTGGGKTIASLAFALKHAQHYGKARVIYVIPYTSIIEQNAAVFKEILGNGNVLEDHCNVKYDSSVETEELKLTQLAAENWDRPVVVTTNEQFFESLFGAGSSKCRKLHNIVNSVIVFDEAQMIPNDYLRPCIAVMEQLIRYYGCTLVLCTATQPALEKFFSEDIKARELCPRVRDQFEFFKRVTMKNMGTVSVEALVRMLKEEKQALCILNTKKQVQQVYRRLSEENVFHLSTAMYPEHRRRVIKKIRGLLKEEKNCKVIATSLVEAGVDFDFQTVYRQAAGVDSIIQAAGRCNREGKRDPEESYVNIFYLDEKESVPGQRQQIAVAGAILQERKDLQDPETVHRYFEHLYHFKGDSLDKKEIMADFQKGALPFRTVAQKFRLIENETITILIPKEDEAIRLADELRQKGFSRERMRAAGQYCVQVYPVDFDRMNGCSMVERVSGDIENLFILREREKYTEETGLELDTESGEALFW